MGQTIGVVITTYNGELFIEEQLESILAQTVAPDLIVVVDDKSTDKTPEIVKLYASKFDQIKFYQNNKNLGWIKNFEKGISLCDTDYISLSDQDDIWFINKIEECLKIMASTDRCGLCYHNSGLIYEDGSHLQPTLWDISDLEYPLSTQEARSILLDTQCPVSGFSMFFSKDLKKYLLPLPGIKNCGHDWWICAIGFFLYNPASIQAPLSYYRMHLNQASGAAAWMLKNTQYEIKKRIFDAQRVRRNLKRIIYSLLYYKKIKQQKMQDIQDRKEEFAFAMGRLIGIIENKKNNIDLAEKEVLLEKLKERIEELAV